MREKCVWGAFFSVIPCYISHACVCYIIMCLIYWVSAVCCFRWQHRLPQKCCIFIQKLQNDPYFAIFGCQNAPKTPKITKKRTFFAFFCKNIWWNEKKAVILHPLSRKRPLNPMRSATSKPESGETRAKKATAVAARTAELETDRRCLSGNTGKQQAWQTTDLWSSFF